MKKKESGSVLHSFRYLVIVISLAQVFLFSQCKKEQDETPQPAAPIAAPAPSESGSSDSETPSDGDIIAAPDPSSSDESTALPPLDNSTGELPADEPAVTEPDPAPSTPATPGNSGTPVTETPEKPAPVGNPAEEKPVDPKPQVPPTPIPPTPTPPATNPVSGKVFTIKANEPIVDASKLNIPAGAIVKLEAGTRGALLLKNFVGSPGAPITIINSSGSTTIRSSGSYGLKVENSKHFRITGSGSSGKGLIIDGGHIGMSMDKLSTDFEIDHVEVKNNGFASIMAKTDPSCDQATWRGNFVMKNLKFHDNYLHDMKGEGFYVGNSFFANGKSLSCGSILPHEIINVEIYNNEIKNSGCEGIQAGCVISGLKIYNNRVTNFGTSPFAAAQDNGVQIGEGSTCIMYNNIVQNGPGNGIIVLGQGNTTIYNNLVINAGSFGAFIDNRGPASGDVAFINNTFITPKKGGIKTYNELVNNKYYNNIIAGTTTFFEYGSNAKGDEKNNLTEASLDNCHFANYRSGDYRLKSTSPGIDKGLNTTINFDYNNKARPSGKFTDIGAYECL